MSDDASFDSALNLLTTSESADTSFPEAPVVFEFDQKQPTELEINSKPVADLVSVPALAAPPTAAEPKKYDAYIKNVMQIQKKLLKEQQASKQSNAELTTLAEQGRKYQELMALKASDPLKFVEDVALNPDDIVKKMVADAAKHKPLTPEEKEEQIITRAREEAQRIVQEDRRKAAQEAEATHKSAYIQNTISEYKNTINQVLEQHADEFELIRTFKLQNKVWEETVNYFNKHNVVPRPEVVAKAIEDNIRTDVARTLTTKFYASLTGKEKANIQRDTSPKSITLTNNSAKASSELRSDNMTDKQRFEETLKLISFKPSE